MASEIFRAARASLDRKETTPLALFAEIRNSPFYCLRCCLSMTRQEHAASGDFCEDCRNEIAAEPVPLAAPLSGASN